MKDVIALIAELLRLLPLKKRNGPKTPVRDVVDELKRRRDAK